MKYYLSVLCLLLHAPAFSQSKASVSPELANRLAALPLKCEQQEYPNKLSQVLNDSSELLSPKALHPAFYGCFDWHSSVHGQWLLVSLLKNVPELEKAVEIRRVLSEQLTAENIQTEMKFFEYNLNQSFERTYGWAWILKLQQEMSSWNDPQSQAWAKNLQPLSDLIVTKYIAFLPKLNYPMRTGEHTNTAFGLTFAYDYASFTDNEELADVITTAALRFYGTDKKYPLQYEPGGSDFLSGALEEADLMSRVLEAPAFQKWLAGFLPGIYKKDFTLEPGKVSDRTDGHLVHLDGLNFSRAWCLYRLAETNPKLKHLRTIADQHLSFSLPKIADGDYMGDHWLASFAVLAILEGRK